MVNLKMKIYALEY